MKKLVFSSLLLATAACFAQAPASEPLRLVLPYSAGGNVDSTARLIAPGLSKALGRSVVIENKTGAGGLIAGEHVAKSKPDGLTMFVTSNGPILHSPLIYGRPVYDWRKDFVPVGSISLTPMVLLSTPDAAITNIRELVTAAKAKPGGLTMAAPGSGSTNHLMALLLEKETGVRFNVVQYKGMAPATTDLLGGHVQLTFDQIAPALPHATKGTLRPVAVTSPTRLSVLPNVPTFRELGLPQLEASSFVGMFAPAGTPPATLATLSAALAKVLAEPETASRLQQLGASVSVQAPGEFSAFLRREDDKWIPLIKSAAIKAE
ncbi:MAG: tripartite tricarboxylate transporter substrate binding protein [Ramlibacter sp.]|nr:tripartite tricarboxylate transporter substrate binding protein [Ramlibacter sp.]